MKHIHTYIRYAVLYIVVAMFFACQQPGVNNPGSEYMPDMAHSIAYEANVYDYYYFNRWGTPEAYHKMAQPRKPVAGTIARGYAGGPKSDFHTPNGAVPYHYGDNDEERTRATNEIIDNPYHITDTGLAKGKELYDVFCGICHGSKGDGVGYLVRDDGGKYPAQPANLLLPEFVSASNGRYYHAIMYGKNLMGGYADKLSYQERWQVIHYVRSLQAKELKLEYSQKANTLNNVEIPASIAMMHEAEAQHHGDSHDGGEHHTDEHHDAGHH